MHVVKLSALSAAIAGAMLLGGCNLTEDSTSSTESFVTLNGSAVAGPVTGQVQVRTTAGVDIVSGDVTDGAFSLQVAEKYLAEELDFVVTGTYTDEVSGSTVTLSASNPLALRLAASTYAAGETAATVGVTPETSIIREMVVNGKTLAQAETAFQSAFGYTPDPKATAFDPTVAAPADATQAQRQASNMVGVYSQWGNDLGLAGDELAQMPAALAADLGDGTLDGAANGVAQTIGSVDLQQLNGENGLTARYMTAMGSYIGGAKNGAGFTNLDLPDLPTAGVTEALPATRVITLASGQEVKVELTMGSNSPLPMMPSVAHNVHKVTLTDNANGAAVDVTAGGTTTAVKSSVLMHMLSGHSHTAPHSVNYDAANSDPANGIYLFDAYYVMASSMGGAPSGVWDFEVVVTDGGTDTSALFHPEVKMAMDGSVYFSKGSNSNDTTMNMEGATSPRPYWAWLNSVTANTAGGHDLTLFISTKVTMMSFPAVYSGVDLGTAMAANVKATVTVEVSVDSGTTWTAMTEDGNGYFSTTALAGLTSGTANTVMVRLTVDGNVMQTAAAENLSLTFTAP